mgnify:CR=1 FL=1
MNRTTVKLQSFGIDTFTFEEALEYIINNPGQVVTINPEMVQCAKNSPEFAEVINSADLVIPDGIGVEIGLKILGYKVRRIAGIEFARKLVDRFSENSSPVAFVGARQEIVKKAVENLKQETPSLNVCYVQDGYFKDDERVLNELGNSGAKLVLVALGSPKQEFFIKRAKELLPDAVMIGIGGSFDVWSGVVKRAPEIYQKLGLEWLYRTVKEPQRFKRIFPTLPLFILKVVQEKFGA